MHRKTRTLNARTIAAAKKGNKVAMEKILDYFRPKLVVGRRIDSGGYGGLFTA